MKFETLTYAAGSTDFSVGHALGSQEALLSSPQGVLSPARLSVGIAAFLLRVAAYFQGCLASLPRAEHITEQSLTVINTSLDDTSGPLQKVRMNRALSRRMRWLIKRGRVERSGKMRLATAKDMTRCILTPGQFLEHSIRVHGFSRIRVYGLGQGRRALRLIAIYAAALQGDGLYLCKGAICLAPLTPD